MPLHRPRSFAAFAAAALVAIACAEEPIQPPDVVRDPVPVPTVECQAHLTDCNGVCVDTRFDPEHCGACDAACTGDTRCDDGVCVDTVVVVDDCPAGQLRCGDPLTNPDHCGARDSCSGDDDGTVCVVGETCVLGTCIQQCGAGGTLCDDVCVDVQRDEANCGGCGAACGTNETCTDGVCSPTGTVLCNGACVDVLSDEANCGSCGTTCGADAFCDAGSCTCPPGFDDTCEPGTDACINLRASEDHCGACGEACADGEVCCWGECSENGDVFIGSFTADNCQVIDHNALTGDDRGGMALGGNHVFVTGDNATARFDLDLGNGASLGRVEDGLFTDLETSSLYSFTINDGERFGTALDNGNTVLVTGVALLEPTTLDTLLLRSFASPLVVDRDATVFADFGAVWIAGRDQILTRIDLHDGVVEEVATDFVTERRPDGSEATLRGTTSTQASFVPDLAGVYELVLEVTDGLVTASDRLEIDVGAAGSIVDAPVANAGPDIFAVVGIGGTLDGGASTGPAGVELDYRWQVVTRPRGSEALLGQATTRVPSFAADVRGRYELSLVVSADGVDSAPDRVPLHPRGRGRRHRRQRRRRHHRRRARRRSRLRHPRHRAVAADRGAARDDRWHPDRRRRPALRQRRR